MQARCAVSRPSWHFRFGDTTKPPRPPLPARQGRAPALERALEQGRAPGAAEFAAWVRLAQAGRVKEHSVGQNRVAQTVAESTGTGSPAVPAQEPQGVKPGCRVPLARGQAAGWESAQPGAPAQGQVRALEPVAGLPARGGPAPGRQGWVSPRRD